jgi:hypothetical protein
VALRIVPMTKHRANAFIGEHHRHHGPVRGCVFTIGVEEDGRLCGVCVVGRPTSRVLQSRGAIEITRLCTDGTLYAASRLIGRARRIAALLGWTRLVSYTLITEHGASHKAGGFREYVLAGGGTWHREARPRTDSHPTTRKRRYEMALDVDDGDYIAARVAERDDLPPSPFD